MKKFLFIVCLSILTNFNMFSQEDSLKSHFEVNDLSKVNNETDEFLNMFDTSIDDWQKNGLIKISEVKEKDGNQLLRGIEYPDSYYINKLKEIPSAVNLTYNEIVKSFINAYANRISSRTEMMLGLTEYYFPIIEPILDQYKLPIELKYMVMIESAFNPKARSRVGASGLWQFMYYTGKQYGLKQNSYYDERYDVIKATHAACEYLKDMYDIFGDWSLVIAAYNCGAGNVNKAIKRSGKKDFWDIYYKLPRETRMYVPSFIAATYICNNYQNHGLCPQKIEFPIATDTLTINRNLHFKQISEVIGLPFETITYLNPQYTRDIILGSERGGKSLRLPTKKIFEFIEKEDSVYKFKKDEIFTKNATIVPSYNIAFYTAPKDREKIKHKVVKGESVYSISNKYGVSVSQLKMWNDMRRNKVKIGWNMTVYLPKEYKKPSSKNAEDNEEYTIYKVKAGETLWEIAKRYNMTVTKLQELNDIEGKGISIGQKLKVKKS